MRSEPTSTRRPLRQLTRRAPRRWAGVATALALPASLLGTTGIASAASRTPDTTGLSVDWVQLGDNNPFWTAENDGAAAAAKHFGFSFKAISGNLSESLQSTELEQLANEQLAKERGVG